MNQSKFIIEGFLPKKQNQIPNYLATINKEDIANKLSKLKRTIIVAGNTHRSKEKNKGYDLIQDIQVCAKIENLCNQGIKYINSQNYVDCLLKLKQADMILCPAIQNDIKVPWKHHIAIKVNLGICFYKVGLLGEAFIYIQSAITYMKINKILIQDENTFFKKSLVVQCCLQGCIILSEMGKHLEAAEFGKTSLRKIIQLIAKVYEYIYNKALKLQVPIQTLSILNQLVQKFECLTAPTLKSSCLQTFQQVFLQTQLLKLQQIDLSSFFRQLDQLKTANTNILSTLQVPPFQMDEVSNMKEVDASGIINKIELLTVSYYCISTEYRFLDKSLEKDSENFLSHALEVAFLFIPPTMPLLGQIFSVHKNFYAPSKQIILEDQVSNDEEFETTLLQQYKGTTQNMMIVPLIRKYKNQKYFSNIEPRLTLKNPSNKLDFQQLLLHTIERAKSAGKKIVMQEHPNKLDQNIPLKQLQEIYTKVSSSKMRVQVELTNNNNQNSKQSPKEFTQQPYQQPNTTKQIHQNFFEQPQIQINNNINIHIHNKEPRKKNDTRAKHLEQLKFLNNNFKFNTEQSTTKSKKPKVILTRDRSQSQKNRQN